MKYTGTRSYQIGVELFAQWMYPHKPVQRKVLYHQRLCAGHGQTQADHRSPNEPVEERYKMWVGGVGALVLRHRLDRHLKESASLQT